VSVGRAVVKANGGFDFCPYCAFCDSETCDFCDEGDQFEESYEDRAVAGVVIRVPVPA